MGLVAVFLEIYFRLVVVVDWFDLICFALLLDWWPPFLFCEWFVSLIFFVSLWFCCLDSQFFPFNLLFWVVDFDSLFRDPFSFRKEKLLIRSFWFSLFLGLELKLDLCLFSFHFDWYIGSSLCSFCTLSSTCYNSCLADKHLLCVHVCIHHQLAFVFSFMCSKEPLFASFCLIRYSILNVFSILFVYICLDWWTCAERDHESSIIETSKYYQI